MLFFKTFILHSETQGQYYNLLNAKHFYDIHFNNLKNISTIKYMQKTHRQTQGQPQQQ